LLQQTYEQSSGIFDYLQQDEIEKTITDPKLKRPLSSVGMNRAENTFIYSKMFDTIKLYADNNVGEFYKMSLVEFLELPHVVCEYILKDSAKRLSAKVSDMNKVIGDMNDMNRK
jgi:hypothetical protein